MLLSSVVHATITPPTHTPTHRPPTHQQLSEYFVHLVVVKVTLQLHFSGTLYSAWYTCLYTSSTLCHSQYTHELHLFQTLIFFCYQWKCKFLFFSSLMYFHHSSFYLSNLYFSLLTLFFLFFILKKGWHQFYFEFFRQVDIMKSNNWINISLEINLLILNSSTFWHQKKQLSTQLSVHFGVTDFGKKEFICWIHQFLGIRKVFICLHKVIPSECAWKKAMTNTWKGWEITVEWLELTFSWFSRFSDEV